MAAHSYCLHSLLCIQRTDLKGLWGAGLACSSRGTLESRASIPINRDFGGLSQPAACQCAACRDQALA